MSCDKTTTEWHLTLKGWIRGSYYYYDKIQEEVTPPAGRVETWEEQMEQSHPTASEKINWECVWTSKNHSQKDRDSLRVKFGQRPKHS